MPAMRHLLLYPPLPDTRPIARPIAAPLPAPLHEAESRIEDGSTDRRVKAVPLLTAGGQRRSQFPDLSTTASGLGDSTAMAPGALGLAAGTMTGYDYR